ncbi:MAG TPA: efflux RND transporter periplasmic adaptor subunit [Polyangiaceae bacterium]|nr:efflux RND transporter periplasmic adaptor subunit [Polyangiaceae bacterium]
MTELPASATPPLDSSHQPNGERPRAPLVGVIAGVVTFVGFAAWAGVRIQAATHDKAAVAAQRNEDAKRANAAAHATASVSTVSPVPASWDPVVEIDGTIAAGQHAEIGFKTNGRISKVLVKVGDAVKAGQLLATLDASEAAAQLRAAEAQERAAQAQLTLANDTDRRTQTMVQSGAVAEGAGVQSAQQRALAAAQLDASHAQVSLSEVTLANQRLVAPFAGSITRAPDGAGGIASPAVSLFELDDLSHLKLKGTLGERDAALVDAGDAVSIDTERGAVAGTITAVLGTVDPATRRVRVEASIDNQGSRLRAGTFVRATVKGKSGLSVLKLPREALRPGSQDEVFVVENETLASRHLAFSIAPDGTLLVRHGLAATDNVVLGPRSDAEPGDRVTVAPATAPAPAAAPAASH